MSAAPRCTVGLLTWNGERDVVACVQSLINQTEPNLEIVWVDNASTDATLHVVREACPQFPAAVVLEENCGFCAGHNRLFKLAEGRYYLALNQDAVLAPDYIQLLCDWMDEVADLGMASGLLLWGGKEQTDPATIYSAGMAMGYGRFPFELDRDRAAGPAHTERRWVPAVTGAAMLIRRSAAADASLDAGELFPQEFFAYFEELDLAMRLAETGWKCGIEGRAVAWHAERGQGGARDATIRSHYFKNHWLVSLRHDSILDWLREFPGIVRGELVHYAPKYWRAPAASLRAIVNCIRLIPASRRARTKMLSTHPAAPSGRRQFYEASRTLLRSQSAQARTN